MRNRIKFFLRFVPLLLLVLLGAAPSSDEWSMNPGAHTPEPIEGFKAKQIPVQLISEHLVINFGRRETHVKLKLTFRNRDPAAVIKQIIGFPDVGAARLRSPKRAYDITSSGPIKNLRTFLNGIQRKTTLRYDYVRKLDESQAWERSTKDQGQLMGWHTLIAPFPANRDTIIEQEYTVQNGIFPYWYYIFEYWTHTARHWQGNIVKFIVDVNLRDGLTVNELAWLTESEKERVIELDPVYVLPEQKEWKVVSETKLHFEKKYLKPNSKESKPVLRLSIRDAL